MISVSVGGVALGNGLRLESLSDIFMSMLCGIESAGEGNRPLALKLVATLEHRSRGVRLEVLAMGLRERSTLAGSA